VELNDVKPLIKWLTKHGVKEYCSGDLKIVLSDMAITAERMKLIKRISEMAKPKIVDPEKIEQDRNKAEQDAEELAYWSAQ